MDVSICCITYNQKEYIEDALNGFLNQKFNHTFELVIHDDASTDGTQEVLLEYQKRYPDKIKLLLEKENQYHKGVKLFYKTIQQANGKYIAFCEGDDYWCDAFKLEKQFKFMEEHSECMYLTHGAYMDIYGRDKKSEFRAFTENWEIELSEVLKNGEVFPTASIFTRRNLFIAEPDFYKNAPIEDEPIKLLCLANGTGYYMNELMCVYRKNHPGSWNATVKQQVEKRIAHHSQKKEMYEAYNAFTKYKYESEINRAILLEDFNIIMAVQDYKKLRAPQYRDILAGLRKIDRVRLKFASYLPHIYRILLGVYKR